MEKIMLIFALVLVNLTVSCQEHKAPVSSTECFDANKKKKALCPDIYKPVCSCDGVTYPNSCFASNAGILRWKEGKCVENKGDTTATKCIDEDLKAKNKNGDCPTIYNPVCGCDGRTYSNSCLATANGVTRYQPGKCKN